MADKAREWTENRLRRMEGRIRDIYTQAQFEMTEKWTAYMVRGQDRLDTLYQAYLSAPSDKKAEALKKYQDAMQSYTLRNQWYQNMVDDTAFRISHVNEIATAYVNGQMPEIYRKNFNQSVPGVENLGIRFDIMTEQTLRRMIDEDDIEMEEKYIDLFKDTRWNIRQMNNSVLQGIIQGESIDKIAERILPIIGNNEKASIRNARTMVTGAENRGRLDRYQDLESQGVVLTKIWIATPDGRTRDWHIAIDGQEVGVNEMFIDGHGNELEYPGDPGAEPETVYNCRCSMRSSVSGIRGADGKIHYISPTQHNGMHQQQIREERMRR